MQHSPEITPEEQIVIRRLVTTLVLRAKGLVSTGLGIYLFKTSNAREQVATLCETLVAIAKTLEVIVGTSGPPRSRELRLGLQAIFKATNELRCQFKTFADWSSMQPDVRRVRLRELTDIYVQLFRSVQNLTDLTGVSVSFLQERAFEDEMEACRKIIQSYSEAFSKTERQVGAQPYAARVDDVT